MLFEGVRIIGGIESDLNNKSYGSVCILLPHKSLIFPYIFWVKETSYMLTTCLYKK